MSTASTEEAPHPAGFPPLSSLLTTVVDLSRPLPQRMRAVFYLRTLGGAHAVEALCAALRNKEGTVLFRHEVAYVLGQMQAVAALPTLIAVLSDSTDDVVVRHECGEAMGAIGHPDARPHLVLGSGDPHAEVADTCALALARLDWVAAHPNDAKQGGDDGKGAPAPTAPGFADDNPYESIDPAPSVAKPSPADVPRIGAELRDQSLPLFERYQRMFSLRNAGTKAAVLELCAGLDDPSPLFRHEVAYVLGQLQHKASVPALLARVNDPNEHEMCRHEAAEALGAIGTGDAVAALKTWAADPTVMLRESCEVALDCVDYWAAPVA